MPDPDSTPDHKPTVYDDVAEEALDDWRDERPEPDIPSEAEIAEERAKEWWS